MSLRTLVPRSIAVAWAATIATAFVVSLLFSLVAGFRSNSPVQWQDLAMAPIFAIPIFYGLRRRGLTSVRAYLFAGALLSMLSLALLYTAYHFKIFLYGQPSLVRIAVTIALVAGPVAALTMRRFDGSVEARYRRTVGS